MSKSPTPNLRGQTPVWSKDDVVDPDHSSFMITAREVAA